MGLNFALVDAASGSIKTGQMHQCRRVYPLRRFAKPLCSNFEVLRYTLPDRIPTVSRPYPDRIPTV